MHRIGDHQKRINHTHIAMVSAMLKVVRQHFGDAVGFGIGSQMVGQSTVSNAQVSLLVCRDDQRPMSRPWLNQVMPTTEPSKASNANTENAGTG